MNKKRIFDVCLIGVLLALGIVFSAFLQFPIFSDIRIDLSYIVIIYVCFRYGPVIGGFFGAGIAGIESTLFSAYGFSISWTCANLVLGIIVGLSFVLTEKIKTKKFLYYFINIAAIVVGVAVAMLGVKTVIECVLYSIPVEVKIVKNMVAFIADTITSLVGFCCLLPRIIKKTKDAELSLAE